MNLCPWEFDVQKADCTSLYFLGAFDDLTFLRILIDGGRPVLDHIQILFLRLFKGDNYMIRGLPHACLLHHYVNRWGINSERFEIDEERLKPRSLLVSLRFEYYSIILV